MIKKLYGAFLVGASFASILTLATTFLKLWVGCVLCLIIVLITLTYVFVEGILPERSTQTNRM